MLKTEFRGERKRILTPSLSQGEGECGDGKREKMTSDERRMTKEIWWKSLAVHIPSCRWLPSKGECSDGKGEKMTSDERRMTKKMWWKSLVGYIPSSRWLPPKGECGDGKGEKMTSDEWRMTRGEWRKRGNVARENRWVKGGMIEFSFMYLVYIIKFIIFAVVI